MTTRNRKILAFCLLVFLAMSSAVQADTGILDNISTEYKTASAGWATTLLGYANRLFFLLAAIEIAWSAAVWVLDKNEFQSFVSVVTKKIMWIGLFYALLLNGPTWIPAIVDSFIEAGTTAGGASAGLSPSEVFTTGLDNAATMLAGIERMGLFSDFGTIVVAGISSIIIVVAFAIIAAQLLVALVESYISISAGLLFLGFGGSRWTTDFVQKFIGYAVATGVKLMMLYLIIGIGNTQAAQWKALLLTIGTPGTSAFNIVLTVLGGSVMLAYLAIQIPAMAASMLSGSPTLTAGGAAQTAGVIGAGIVGAGAAAAATTLGAAKSVGGVAAAAKSAWGEAGAQGSTGLSRSVATLGNMGTAAMRDTSNRASDAIGSTKGGRMSAISENRAAELNAANSFPSASGPASSGTGSGNVAPPTPSSSGAPQASSQAQAQAPNQSTASAGGATVAGNSSSSQSTAQASPAGASTSSPNTSPSEQQSSSSASQAAPAMAAGMPAGTSESTTAKPNQAPGFEDRLRNLQQVQPPQFPSDAAPPATVHIRFDSPQD